ncbi:hypothetical protein BKA93DRAFT_918663 [Sparassis latifolia]|uniref:Uncharacterized protein n=1 Tax=Sparassis crispa TaxID=139825 RepID=A0A401H5Z9_9APHY|nr:hypothetical protein SCP_1701380 [Sparassis crispa]GBE89813.1 hypothetical protein SCP_1701380 [Sparassis crispa]
MSAPTYDEIRDVARKAVDIFGQRQLRCCLFGSTACALYGTSRCPNDVDLVVLDPESDPEDLKQMLVDGDVNFYLVPSKDTNATYQVLWYILPYSPDGQRRMCKVDILIPGGDLGIPFVPAEFLETRHNFPVMPILPLLLLKLQGWVDHRSAERWSVQEKQHADVEDIEDLIIIACDQRVHTSICTWLPQEFFEAAEDRVEDYAGQFPLSSLYWYTLGFDVE